MSAHLVGGGIASLAGAVYLIQDAGLPGAEIYIYEAGERFGGSLGIFGDLATGYASPGARVYEKEYRCAFDLFSMIELRTDPRRSIKDDILEFNAQFGWDNRTRLIDDQGQPVQQGPMGLHLRDQLALFRLVLTPEVILSGKRISEYVTSSFLESHFWYIWSSIMAIRPDHSAVEMRRYLRRFVHILPQLWDMRFILRTRLNQYQYIVEPITTWLAKKGVNFYNNCPVSDILLNDDPKRTTATALRISRETKGREIALGSSDVVFVTNGSQLFDMRLGTMSRPPEAPPCEESNSWKLWRVLASKRPDFGNPSAFADHIQELRWVSFTVTDRGVIFSQLIESLTGRKAGRGGLITFKYSNWLITISLFHSPYFLEQPAEIFLLWGYGIYPERNGNFVKKPMIDCSGTELVIEVLSHLRFDERSMRS